MMPVSRRIIHLAPGDLRHILQLMRRGEVFDGHCIARFEEEFARYVGTGHAVAAATGRLGLKLLLEAYDLEPGGKVILPAYEDLSVPRVIRDLGLEPLCVDIDPATYNISVSEVEKHLDEHTVAIIATHLFGNPCDISRIADLAAERGIPVIEDCAHAVGTTIDGRHAGTFGDAAFFSFHTTKPFMTFGGCMVTTDDDTVAGRVREGVASLPFPAGLSFQKRFLSAIGMHVLTRRGIFAWALYPWLRLWSLCGADPVRVYNRTIRRGVKIRDVETRYTNLQASIGLRHLAQVDDALRCRRRNVAVLDSLLAGKVQCPALHTGSNGYFYIIMAEDAELIRRQLLARGIDTGMNLMRNISLQTENDERCPNTATAIARSIQIPVYETLSEKDMQAIARAVLSVVK
ncbi:MAG: DegT/DnrJ/EryC1/StrS aminotransferase family protein [Kiritimatiellia bacterium]|jgi:dTDP-4-amino-4,6-dideoxygalactose transaminase|nr:DegT/DnrJ/EryC1/StrS aminotransferase family protein [Kiritimatiellia bacterium]